MLKYITLVLCLLVVSFGSLRSQTTMSSQDLRAFRIRQILDAIQEKTHMPAGSIPGIKTEESEMPLSNPVGEQKISTDARGTSESEVHAAINPTDTTNIVVSPIDLSTTLGLTLPIYYTNNFGQSWKKSTFKPAPYLLNASVSGGGDPVFAFDADGKLYYSWIDLFGGLYDSSGVYFDTIYTQMYWASSTNGGQTWQRSATGYIGQGMTVEVINTNLLSIVNPNFDSVRIDTTTGTVDKEWLTVDRTNSPYHNTLYAAWTRLGTKNNVIAVTRKRPGIDSMEAPVTVTPDNFLAVQFTSLGVDAKGGLHVTFMGTFDTTNYAMYHVYSGDGGVTFTAPVKISDADLPRMSGDAKANMDTIFGVPPKRDYPCPHLSIDTSVTGNLYMVWTALGTTTDLQRGTDIYFTRSTDNGAHWNAVSIINNDRDTDSNPPTDHFYSSISVNGKGTITVAWYDRREDPNNQIGRYYIAQSTDQGTTWTNGPIASQPMDFNDVTDVNGNFGIGEYTQVLASPYCTIPVWTDGRDNSGNLRVYAAFLYGSPLASVQRLSTVSDGVSLSDNYPNPFSTTTKVSFTLASPAHAVLYVTNVTGQRVASLYDGSAGAGEHDFTFDGSHLSDGVYYLNLESDLGVVREAMTILR
jgi:hypothetical protein